MGVTTERGLISIADAAQRTSRPRPPSAQPPTPKIVVRNLDFFYGKSRALADINITFYDKSVTALIGPSGCGKSTLLRVLNRMYELYPEQRAVGEVLLDGTNILHPLVDAERVRTRVGMVFQKPMPFPMSIYENVAFGMKLYTKPSHSVLDERVENALRRADLWDEVKDILKRSGHSLSGGQQQRLCIARTIAAEPEVLLLDEPCSALDPTATSHIEQLIDELRRQYCVIIVTHNMQQAARVSDRTAFMYLGRLIEFDITETIFRNPSRHETEAFVTGRFG